jgi:hypothetical protein
VESRLHRWRALVALLAFAAFGRAHGFFGNLYETVVVLPGFAPSPERAGQDEGEALFITFSSGSRRIFAPGSPVLYYVPLAAPLAGFATLAALVAGWRFERVPRGRLLGASVSSIGADLLTAYIVARINGPLFLDPSGTTAARWEALKRRWVLLNNVRFGLVGTTLALLVSVLVAIGRSLESGPSSGR